MKRLYIILLFCIIIIIIVIYFNSFGNFIVSLCANFIFLIILVLISISRYRKLNLDDFSNLILNKKKNLLFEEKELIVYFSNLGLYIENKPKAQALSPHEIQFIEELEKVKYSFSNFPNILKGYLPLMIHKIKIKYNACPFVFNDTGDNYNKLGTKEEVKKVLDSHINHTKNTKILIILGTTTKNSIRQYYFHKLFYKIEGEKEFHDCKDGRPGHKILDFKIRIKDKLKEFDDRHIGIIEKICDGERNLNIFFCAGYRADTTLLTSKYLIKKVHYLYNKFKEKRLFRIVVDFGKFSENNYLSYDDTDILVEKAQEHFPDNSIE